MPSMREREKKEGRKPAPEPKKRKDHRLQHFLLGIFIFLAFIFIVLAFSGFKFRFLLNNELNLEIKAEKSHFNVTNRDSVALNFSITNKNFANCRSFCNFSLYDLSRGSLLYSGSRLVLHDEAVNKEFILPPQGIGKGQALYQFEAECHNIRSAICLTQEERKYSSSLVLVDYTLSDEEIPSKEVQKPIIQQWIGMLADSERIIKENAEILSRIPGSMSEKAALAQENAAQEESFTRLKQSLGQALYLWNNEEYLFIPQILTQSIIIESSALLRSSESLQQGILGMIALRNNNIKRIEGIYDDSKVFSEAISFYTSHYTDNARYSMEDYSISMSAVKESYDSILQDKSHSEKGMSNNVFDAIQSLNAFKDSYDELGCISAFEAVLLDYYINISYSLKSGLAPMPYSSPYTNASPESSCINISLMIASAQSYNSEANESRNDIYMQAFNVDPDTAESSVAGTSVLGNAIANAENSAYYLSLIAADSSVAENQDFACKAIISGIISSRIAVIPNITEVAEISLPQLNASANESLIVTRQDIYTMSAINYSSQSAFLNENCIPSEVFNQNILYPDFINTNVLSRHVIDSSVPNISIEVQELEEPKPKCCFMNACKECCDESCELPEKSYPVLLVHGHALTAEEDPLTSFTTYTKIQKKLQEDGFINGGELDITYGPEEKPYAEWKRMNSPIAIRTSYYYISFYDLGAYSLTTRKSERIENYALRLKERIDLLKYRTGSPKVNIIAHSMGGLVIRQYLSLFGYDSVNKIITTNSPHHGITGSIKRLCYLGGAIDECDDMDEDSIFMKRINSEKIPEGAKFYAIRSIGCQMANETGDGVVTNSSAYLEGAQNFAIEGKCTDSLNVGLHNDVLDPEKYPEAYELLLELLAR